MRNIKETNDNIRMVRKSIKKYCIAGHFDDKEIILFGVTAIAPHVISCLAEHGVRATAFIDNAPEKVGKAFHGIPVFAPSDFLFPQKVNVAILLCSKTFSREQSRQLSIMGYKSNKDYFAINNYILPLHRPNVPLLLKMAIETMKSVKGLLLYRRIMKPFGSNCKMLLCPYPGTGDIYLTGMYLNEYLKKNNIEEYVLVISNGGAKRILSLFSIVDLIEVKDRQIDSLLVAYNFFCKCVIKLKPLQFWGWKWRVKMRIDALHDKACPFSFADDFKYDVFELDESSRGIVPKFDEDSYEVDSFFIKHNLIKGKTVILSPYAGHNLLAIPMPVWEIIAMELTARGYSVCTNSAGEDEPPISGTQAVFFNFSNAVPIVNAAGYFIGIRSGLCDIISSSSCKMIIIYLSASNVIPMHYFSLKRMGLNENAIEFEYDGLNDYEFADSIIKVACE